MINISIELTNFCNAKCYYCGTGQDALLRQKGFLSLDVHTKLIQDLKIFMNDFTCASSLDKSIYLRYCGVGEPVLHPHFIRMFKDGLAEPNVRQVAVLSNGSKWTKELVDDFVEICATNPLKPIELVFSLDTLNSQTQSKIKRLTNIKDIIDQLLYLLDQKSKKHLRNVYPVFQMIILEENKDEVKKFCEFWTGVFAAKGFSSKIVYEPDYAKYFSKSDCFIWLKRRDIGSSGIQKDYAYLYHYSLNKADLCVRQNDLSATTDKSYNDSKFSCRGSKFGHICSMLWYGVNIAASGDVSPCCIDVNFDLKIGNLIKNSIIEVYRGNAMRCLRLAHISGDLHNYPLCKNCAILHHGNTVLDEDVVKYMDACKTNDLI